MSLLSNILAVCFLLLSEIANNIFLFLEIVFHQERSIRQNKLKYFNYFYLLIHHHSIHHICIGLIGIENFQKDESYFSI